MEEKTKPKRSCGCAVVICLGIIGFLAVIFLPWPQPTLHEFLDKQILAPIPQGMTNIQKISYCMPSLGDGLFVVKFEYNEIAREQLLKKWQWTTNDHAGYVLQDRTDLLDSNGQFYEYERTNRLFHLELHFLSNGKSGILAGHL